MKSLFKLIIIAFSTNFLIGCKHDVLDIDTSEVVIEPIVFKRLDKDVFCLTSENCSQKMKNILPKNSSKNRA